MTNAGKRLVGWYSQKMASWFCVENSKYDNNIIGDNFSFNFSNNKVNIVIEAHFKKISQKMLLIYCKIDTWRVYVLAWNDHQNHEYYGIYENIRYFLQD